MNEKKPRKLTPLFILNLVVLFLAAYISVGLLPATFGRSAQTIWYAIQVEAVLSVITLVALIVQWFRKRD